MDVEELLEMVPYEQMVNLGMEYALSDPQVKNIMQYISSDKFRNNVVEMEFSPEFLKVSLLTCSNSKFLSLCTNLHENLQRKREHVGIPHF